MTKNQIILAVVAFVAGILIVGSLGKNKNNSGQIPTGETTQNTNIFSNLSDLCLTIPKEKITSLYGEPIVKTETFTRSNSWTCEYFVDATNFVGLHLENMSVENQKKGNTFLDRTIEASSKIPMENFLARNEKGDIVDIYLVLGPNQYVRVSRSSSTKIPEDKYINFASKVVGLIK